MLTLPYGSNQRGPSIYSAQYPVFPPPSPLHRAVRPATSSLLCASGAGPPECGPIPLSMRFFVENPAIGISLLEPGPSPHGMRPAQIPAGLRLEDRDVESHPAALRCVDRGFGFVAPDELPRQVDSRLAPIGLALAAPFSRQRIDRRILRANPGKVYAIWHWRGWIFPGEEFSPRLRTLVTATLDLF